MSRVYSKLLITAHNGAGPIYTVPAGYTTVVRCITAFNGNAGFSQPVQIIHVASSCTIYQRTLGAQETQIQELRFVANETDELQLETGPDCDLTLSGYELLLP